jgi:hypothetical protein
MSDIGIHNLSSHNNKILIRAEILLKVLIYPEEVSSYN